MDNWISRCACTAPPISALVKMLGSLGKLLSLDIYPLDTSPPLNQRAEFTDQLTRVIQSA